MEEEITNFFESCKSNGEYYLDLLRSEIISGKFVINSEDIKKFNLELFEKLYADDLFETKINVFSAIVQIIKKNNFIEKPFGLSFTEPLEKLTLHINPNETMNSSKIKQLQETNYKSEDFGLVAKIIKDNSNYITIRENDDVYWFNGKFYEPNGEQDIREKTHHMIRDCKKKTTLEVIDWIRRDKTYVKMKDFYNNSVINCENGILDPETFELKPHDPKYYTLSVLPITINSQARNVKLWNRILEIADPRDIPLILELIWIGISWKNPFKKMFIFKGLPDTQKSTLADIIAMIIGEENVSRQAAKSFLSKDARFGSSHFIGKRMNIATEIGDLDEDHLERQKSYVGAEKQNTERKNDNAEYIFDPSKFVFLYTTNKLGKLYASIEDNSVITRYQFLIFRNVVDPSIKDGDWLAKFFTDENEKKEAISTIVNIVINYKKAQKLNKIPKTRFSTVEETKKILKEQQDPEDKYFEDNRLVRKPGERLTVGDIQKDFEQFVGYKITPAKMGYILRKNGFTSKQTNSQTVYEGVCFAHAEYGNLKQY
jgi:phage/plasmid-associated DNA primase